MPGEVLLNERRAQVYIEPLERLITGALETMHLAGLDHHCNGNHYGL
jgi:hypothetical protein